MRDRNIVRSLAAAATLSLAGCYAGLSADGDGAASADGDETADGDAGDGDTGTPPPPELECQEIGPLALRRISSTQYEQILSDLLPGELGEQARAVSIFPKTDIDGGFSTYAAANTVSSNESIQIEDNAEAIAEVFYDNIDAYGPELIACLPPGFTDSDIDDCVDGFIAEFGARAFRRALTDGETQIVRGLYNGIKESDDAQVALTAVVHYFLQAPALLYITEKTGPQGEPYVALGPSELATRLALLFTNSTPDEELMTAVAEGRLHSREDVEREARRLVAEPAAVRAFAQFHHEWMRGFELDDAQREHPMYSTEASQALQEELGAFATWFLAQTDGSFETLMTTKAFPADPRLAEIYGEGPQRVGMLSTAAAMAALAHDDTTSLVERGAFVRRNVLCIPVPALPGDIDVDEALGGFEDLPTQRERLEPLMTNPSCAGCHLALNPLGFPFEVYDWVGAYRATENGAPIDTTLEIELGSLSGRFDGAEGLLNAIAATPEARDCYATQWFRYAVGRHDAPEDECTLDLVRASFEESGGDVRELLVAIAVSDAFRFRKVGAQ